jgi:hypothetical protein
MVEQTKEFYNNVITDVIEKNRQLFISEGISEDVLEKLKKLWIEKLMAKTVPENDGRIHDYPYYGQYMLRDQFYGHYPYKAHPYGMHMMI